MIKLIASDIDGTLVKDGTNVLNPEIYEVILKLRREGFNLQRPAAASGAALSSCLNL